jgi:protein-disulfide isomerase
MNKYLGIFFGFIAFVIVAFFATRTAYSPTALETATGHEKPQKVVSKINPEDKAKALTVTAGDYSMGSETAPVVLIEYASMSCPHCAEVHEKIIEPLIPTYIESGKVRYVFRDFPLNAPALEASKLAHCAGKDRYFSFVKVLFQSQPNWVLALPELKKIAAMGGIDEAKYDECQKNKDIENKILTTQKEATDILEVESTPTLFINGHLYDGAYNFEQVSEFIDKLLKGE